MQIETYFQEFRAVLEACLVVLSHCMSYDKRGTHVGFIRGEVYFVDGSVLHLREFVDVETRTERLLYVYQYTDVTGQLIFRYDNTGHHRKLNLPTYPHHKHVGSEMNIIPSLAPDFTAVLSEIAVFVQLPPHPA